MSNIKIYILVMILCGMGYAVLRFATKRDAGFYIGATSPVAYALSVFSLIVAPFAGLVLIWQNIMLVAFSTGRRKAMHLSVFFTLLLPWIQWNTGAGGSQFLPFTTVSFLQIGFAIALAMAPKPKRADRSGWTLEDGVVVWLCLILWIGPYRFPSTTAFLREGLETALSIGLPYLLLRKAMRSVADVRLVICTVAGAAVIQSVLALYEARAGWLPFTILRSPFMSISYASTMMTRGNALRSGTTLGIPLALSLLILMGFAASICSLDKFKSKAWAAGCVFIVFMGLVATQSRSALLVCALVGVLGMAFLGRKGLAIACAGVATGGYVVLIGLAAVVPRIAVFMNMNPGATRFGTHSDYRGLLLERGMQEGAKHMWTGLNIQTVLANLQDIVQGEGIVDFVNTYLYLYLVSGLLGLVPLAIMIFMIVKNLAFDVRIRGDNDFRAARAFAITALIMILVEITFISFISIVPYCLMLTLAVSRTVRMEYVRHRNALRAKVQPLAPSIEELAPALGRPLPPGRHHVPTAT